MAKRIILTIIVLAIAIGLIYWYQESRNNDDVSARTNLSVAVFNQTKNADATTVTANPNDILVYTMTVENTSDDTISGYVVETNIDDLSELATLTDAAGANYNASTNSLMWTPLDIPENGSIQKTFTVRVKEALPSDSDFVVSVTFNNNVDVIVAKPTAAAPAPTPSPTPVPPSPYKAPTTGPSAWFALVLALAFTAGVILFRAAKRISI